MNLKRKNLIILGAKNEGGTESKKPLPFPKDEWLCFENISSDLATIKMNASVLSSNTIYYSYDNKEYELFSGSTTIPAQSKIYFYWENYIEKSTTIWVWECSKNYKVSGELKYADKTNYSRFFTMENKLIDASELKLTATILTDDCYSYMFNGCSNLTTAPQLPATTLADDCYSYMFQGCTALTTAPQLPATTLADSCYSNMFKNCTSLTTAPTLPATELASSCYNSMFQGCTSLTTAPTLPATTLADSCYRYMFQGCTSLTTAPELPVTTLTSYCYSYMFNKCSSLTTAPQLPATTLASYCYDSMFEYCSSLTTAPQLPATTLAEKCYYYMFCNCTSLNYVKTYIEDWNTSNTTNWLSSVASEGTVETLSDNIPTDNSSGIPSGWTKKIVPIDRGLVITNLSEIENEILITGSVQPYRYRIDDGEWVNVEGSVKFTIQNKVAIDGYYNNDGYGRIITTQNFALSGNLNNTANENAYTNLFKDNEKLIYAHDLVIGDENTKIGEHSCYSMFNGCINLQTAPQIKCNSIGGDACNSMFEGCTSLVDAPQLPATYVSMRGYWRMFYGCTSLVQSPTILPSKTVGSDAYYSMFEGCASLETTPEICLTELNTYAIENMFKNCSKVNYVKIHVINWNTTNTSDWLSGVASEGTVVCNSSNIPTNNSSGVPKNWTKKGFAIDNTLILSNNGEGENTFTLSDSLGVYQYKINENDWQEVEELTSNSITVQQGDVLTLYGIINVNDKGETLISATDNFSVSGTLNFNADYAFKGLFLNNDKLINADELYLADNFKKYCYDSMFKGCTNLSSLPIFSIMGDNAEGCYQSMFEGCTNISSMPTMNLNRTTKNMYKNMFKDCTNLSEIVDILPAEYVAESCYESMFEGCTAIVNAPKLPAINLNKGCYRSMFKNCTSLVKAEEISAVTLSYESCNSMFEGCTNLSYVKISVEDWQSANTNNWLLGVASSGLLVNTSSNLIFNSASGVPEGWNVETFVNNKFIITPFSSFMPLRINIADTCTNYTYQINDGEIIKVPELTSQSIIVQPGETLTIYGIGNNKGEEGKTMIVGNNGFNVKGVINEVYDYSYYKLFGNSEQSVNLMEVNISIDVKTLAPYCFASMFRECKSWNFTVNYNILSNVLTLAPYCCLDMFYYCTSLTTAPALPALELAEGCYQSMFHTTNLESAPELPATTLKEHCYDAMFVATQITSITLPAEVVPEGAYSWLLAYSQINEITLKCIDAISSFNTQQWVEGVPEGGTIYLNPNASWGETIERGVTTIPETWNVAYYE